MTEADSASFETLLGGVMTDEVGVISGPVEIRLDDDLVRIRYEGALEWYTAGPAAGRSLDELVRVLTTDPGVDEYGNPREVSLRG